MHNLKTVINFEIIRAINKKSFWIISLLFPFLVVIILAIAYFSNQTTEQIANDLARQSFSMEIMDESKIINAKLLKNSGFKTTDDKTKAIAKVKAGQLDSFVHIPNDLQAEKIKIYAEDVGIFKNNRYSEAVNQLLRLSVSDNFSPSEVAVVSGKTSADTQTFLDGKKTDPLGEAIVPGLFLVLFYIVIVTFGNYMLSSTTEEKENRVIEMILTTVRAKTLIVGKMVSLIILGLLNVAIVATPLIIGYLLFRDKLALPDLDLSSISIDPIRVLIAFVVFIASFLMFTGILVTLGSIMPTAKEANSFFGVVALLLFGPLYAVTLFVSAPESLIVQIMSYFPLTAPIPLLLRNAVGNLSTTEAMIAIAILSITTLIIIGIATRAFRTGSLEYSRRLGLKEIFTAN